MFPKLPLALALLLASPAAVAQSNHFFVSGNVMTGQMWHPATDAGTGRGGTCSVGSELVQYYSAPFFTDQTADTYTLQLYYESFQSGFVYLYQDRFDPSDPCQGIFEFGYAPLANIYDIHLDANRQYFFVTSEDTLYGGGGSFQASIYGPTGSHLFPGAPPSQHAVFCFGDGSGAACPCGNFSSSGSGQGCLNSTGVGGSITAQGVPSISSDSLVLRGSQMPNTPVLYIQGSGMVNGGSGAAYGDGLRCVSGATVRLGIKRNVNGSSSYPAAGDLPISIRGGIPGNGGTFVYQGWYRNPDASFCTTATLNLTNAVRVTWGP